MTFKIYLYREWTPGDADQNSRARLALAAEEYFAALGEAPEAILRDGAGKPYFGSGRHFVSVTHTGPLFAAAFAAFPIGLDAERAGQERSRVRTKFFPEEKDAPFDAVWTGKESVGKLVGTGLSAALGVRVLGRRALYRGTEYRLHALPCAGYCLTLATEKGIEEIGIQTLSKK